MPSQFDSFEVDLTCPKCSKQFQKTVARLKMERSVICPWCGHRSEVAMEQLRNFELELERFSARIKKDPK